MFISPADQHFLSQHKVTIDVQTEQPYGTIIFNARRYHVKLLTRPSGASPESWSPRKLQEDQMQYTAAKVAVMLVKKSLLQQQPERRLEIQIHQRGFTDLTQRPSPLITHESEDDKKNTRRDYDELMDRLANVYEQEGRVINDIEEKGKEKETEAALDKEGALEEGPFPIVVRSERMEDRLPHLTADLPCIRLKPSPLSSKVSSLSHSSFWCNFWQRTMRSIPRTIHPRVPLCSFLSTFSPPLALTYQPTVSKLESDSSHLDVYAPCFPLVTIDRLGQRAVDHKPGRRKYRAPAFTPSSPSTQTSSLYAAPQHHFPHRKAIPQPLIIPATQPPQISEENSSTSNTTSSLIMPSILPDNDAEILTHHLRTLTHRPTSLSGPLSTSVATSSPEPSIWGRFVRAMERGFRKGFI